MPVRLTLCDLGAPGWGEPWSELCCFSHMSLYGDDGYCSCSVAFDFFAIPI